MLHARWGSWRHGSRRARTLTSWLIGSRRSFASISRDEPVERLNITCGSAGSITVDLYNPKALTTPSSPLIIYLPPSGTHLKTQHPSIPPFLFSQYGALASINYRWNIPTHNGNTAKLLSSHPSFATHPFPTPLHDTLHAYDYLTTALLSRFAAPEEKSQNAYWNSQSKRKQIPRPVIIYGSYLGGTLATSLALTESFSSKRRTTQIAGVIAKNAILDWTEIATTKAPDLVQDVEHDLSQIIRAQQPWTRSTLHALKTSLFTRPASCFDTFVSPMLFLYSAGTIPPVTWVTADGQEMSIEDALRVDVSIPASSDSLSGSDSGVDVDGLSPSASSTGGGKHISTLDIQTTRSAHLKFPPRESGLKIPRSLFLASSLSSSPSSPPPSTSTAKASSASSLAKRNASKSKSKSKTSKKKKDTEVTDALTPHNQAEEMARLMRRSIVLHEFKERVMYDSDVDPHAVSEERIRVVGVEGIGDGSGVDGELSDKGEEEKIVREWIEDSLS